MRDLKADLELCKQMESNWEKVGTKPWLPEELYGNFAHVAREGWPYAIERALEAEKRVGELESQVDILSTTLNMYCSPYYDMRERAEKAEALARELVEALEIASDAMYLDIMNAHDYPSCEVKVKSVLAKAKEVLGR